MSFLQHVFSGMTGDFKGAFTTSKTVRLEKMQDKEILRFGPNETDYFPVEGNSVQKAALREILSKAVESETMLKKIRALPVEDRPTLCMENSLTCGGWCDGKRICLCYQSGTGYTAAGVFAHEFQHQYQYKKGDGLPPRIEFSVADQMLNDRIYESAADAANFQYLYEIRDKNPQARKAYAENYLFSSGLRSYAKAKNDGKPEDEAILAGMKGYALSWSTADSYAKSYHPEFRDPYDVDMIAKHAPKKTGDRNEDYKAGIDVMLSGREQPDFAALMKVHTVGMTAEPISDVKSRRLLRDPDYNYVTSGTARTILKLQKRYKTLTGEDHASAKNNFWVRNVCGVFTVKGEEGLPGLLHKAGNAVREFDPREPIDDKPSLMTSLKTAEKTNSAKSASLMRNLKTPPRPLARIGAER